MQKHIKQHNGQDIAVVTGDAAALQNGQDLLDLLATIRYEDACERVALCKDILPEEFFNLRSGVLGDMLQKVVNYHFKLAVFGDFSSFTSKALRDFITECNRGKDIFFVSDESEAIERLAAV